MTTNTESAISVHLVCNAHLDPVWLWEWEEGAAEALSTFRVAAEFCEQTPGFIFCHNEAILYRWVEEYESDLFKRIQTLVKNRQWHIMGGWHLQPDCNMPSGESFVRQILLGREYFKKKFGVAPSTAINFDPFGHTRGLVQILAKSGYDSYLFCRPDQSYCRLPRDEFIWEGYDGSTILAARPAGSYLSARGAAKAKAESIIKQKPDNKTIVVLWGIGNHGGGPSRIDLRQLQQLIRKSGHNIRHSTPEKYFAELRKEDLPVHSADLNPWAPGCYTSQVRIKQNHRLLENELYMAEKMASAAWVQKRMPYPTEELHDAQLDLATAEFHDILPGSSIAPVERAAVRMMDHGLEILSRIKARSFFALAQGQPRARGKRVPILVYNPHPYAIDAVVECEFMLPDQNWTESFTDCAVYGAGKRLPTQTEQQLCSLDLDWRKRVLFRARLEPSQMNRFDCKLTELSAKPRRSSAATAARNIRIKTTDLDVVVNTRTGLIDRYKVRGKNYLCRNACRPLVMKDSADSWGMNVRRFRTRAGAFRLLSRDDSARVSGVDAAKLPAVRVVEDGPVRCVVESIFGYGRRSTIIQRYKIPKKGSCIEIECVVHWHEKDKMLKLSLPTPMRAASYIGQVAYGRDSLPCNGDEAVAQKWTAVLSDDSQKTLLVMNDGIYGSDMARGEVRMTLLRSPAYSGHPIGERPIVQQDRYTPRIDQGSSLFRIWIDGGTQGILAAADRMADLVNEKPMALSFYPHGEGKKARPLIALSDRTIQMTVAKKSEHGDSLIIRLFEPTGKKRTTNVSLPFCGMRKQIVLKPFEIATYIINVRRRTWRPVDLMERGKQGR